MTREVSATRERSGLLLYYSALEDQLELLPDLGIQAKTPGARFNEARHRFLNDRTGDLAGRLCRLVADVAGAVKSDFPPGADNPNELPDRPRVEE